MSAIQTNLLQGILIFLIIIISSCTNPDRYQMTVEQGFVGESIVHKPQVYMYDSKTGEVFWLREKNTMVTWNPISKQLTLDTLRVVKN